MSGTRDSIAETYWAAHLGCAPAELFAEPFRVITHGEELSDYDGVFALFRGGSAIASVPAYRADALRALLSSDASVRSPLGFAHALRSVAAAVIGPAFIGYAEAVPPPTHPVRTLTLEDTNAVKALQQACDETQWEHGRSSLEHPCSGVFIEGQLAALAGYEIWGKAIAHIAIITHPDFRGCGYARSAAAHLAARALAAGLLPQYRTLESNRASIHIAEALGFAAYATSVAVRLRPEDERADSKT